MTKKSTQLFLTLGKRLTNNLLAQHHFTFFRHEVLSDYNCFQESCIGTNFLSIDLVVEAFPLVPCTSAINFLVQESQSKVVSLTISLLANNGSDCSAKTGLSVLVRQVLYSSHKSEIAPQILS